MGMYTTLDVRAPLTYRGRAFFVAWLDWSWSMDRSLDFDLAFSSVAGLFRPEVWDKIAATLQLPRADFLLLGSPINGYLVDRNAVKKEIVEKFFYRNISSLKDGNGEVADFVEYILPHVIGGPATVTVDSEVFQDEESCWMVSHTFKRTDWATCQVITPSMKLQIAVQPAT